MEDCGAKAVDLICNALSVDSTGYPPNARGIAEAIETELLKEYGSTANRDFRTKVRSIVFNLKDPKNAYMRTNLLNGTLAASAFAHKGVHELANPDKQEELHKLEEKLLEETIIQKLPPGQEGEHVKKVEFLTLVGRVDDSEQATHPPPDQHQQMLQSR